jgi:PAS domain S-box-containing protein
MKQPILPEVREAADRLAAQRALTGVPVYPFVVVTAGVAANLPERRPYLFLFLLVVVLALAVLRVYLTRRFERIYSTRPGLWRNSFYGSMILNAVLLGGLFSTLIVRFGPQVESFFILAIAAVIASMAILLYAHTPRVVATFATALLLPILLSLGSLLGHASMKTRSWEGLCIAVFLGYLSVFAAQLYRERWAGLTSTHLLAIRAAELERAQDELRHAHDGLERLVDERAQDLRKANEDYRQIFESAHDAIFVLAPADESILNVNRRACELYGFSREEFLGMSLADVSENIARGRDHVAKTLEQSAFYVFETTQFRRDGSRIFLEVNASLIEYEGRPAILSINRDVTERRKAEELRLAKDAAEQADRAKSRFLANMSHEIRTPMAGVLGLVDLLLKTDLSSPQRDYVTLVQSSATSLLRLIDDILDFSKIEAGRLLLERVPFDLPATLREIVELLRFRASAQGTELGVDFGPGVPRWVWGDPGRLRQVLTNLVGNAVKFTEDGQVWIEVWPLADGRLRFEITDTGIGIPKEAQERLFELFSQADSSTSRRYGGSGLGLAISQRIVQQMEGEIGCESEPGEGSTFWFHLRFEPASPPLSLPLPGDDAVPRRPGRQRRILVAEDNVVNQLVVTQHLAALGYEVLAVNNGREALQALERTPVDLVLMDCQMPELDGYEATRQIRLGAAESRGVPIVALTAHAMKEELERCLAVGMNDYITKPFRKEALQQKLELWLDDGKGADEGSAGAPEGGMPAIPATPPVPPNPADPPVFDGEKLLELRRFGRALGQDVLRDLAATWRSQTCLEEMRAGLGRGDRPLVWQQAHSLKGSSAALGARRLAALCAELEQLSAEAGEAGDEAGDEACAGRIAAIEEEYQRVLAGLVAAAAEESPEPAGSVELPGELPGVALPR